MSPRSPAWAAWVLLVFVAGCDRTPLERSCGGESVDLCEPREVAVITEASLTPDRLTIADFDLRAQIRVVLDRCEDAPATHAVDLIALVPGDDAGAGGVRVMSLLTLEDGDGDGLIDSEEINPFIATIPPETDLTLRFVARSTRPGGCVSGSLEVPYRTGPARPGP